MKIKNKKDCDYTTELCPYCNKETPVPNKLGMYHCVYCGAKIISCSMCLYKDCSKCLSKKD